MLIFVMSSYIFIMKVDSETSESNSQ